MLLFKSLVNLNKSKMVYFLTYAFIYGFISIKLYIKNGTN